MAPPAALAALLPYPPERVPTALYGGVVAIGNFDGVHRGHVALLEAARAEASRRGVPALVLSFDPHPRSVLRPEQPVFRLTPLPAKARLLKALDMDGLAVATFDRTFAAMSAAEFIAQILVADLRISGVVVGFNFRFGQNRAGNADTLMSAGREAGFSVTVVDAVRGGDGIVVASSDIRHALERGEVSDANGRLGYRWFAVGRVEHGAGRGRDLGFPTANLRLPPDSRLRHGIYAVRVQRPGGAIHDGVASFGVRPVFEGGEPLLEVHLIDFEGGLYGEEIAVAFLGWIRPEQHFESVAALIAAISADVGQARAILAESGPGSPLDKRLAALP
jgi:riboflavin kinase/FMN adenylyltransferase